MEKNNQGEQHNLILIERFLSTHVDSQIGWMIVIIILCRTTFYPVIWAANILIPIVRVHLSNCAHKQNCVLFISHTDVKSLLPQLLQNFISLTFKHYIFSNNNKKIMGENSAILMIKSNY